MPTPTDHQTVILQLRTEIDRLYDRAVDPGSSQFRSKYDEVAALWEKLRALTQKASSGDISDFFDAIGSGVIGAQKRLDRASEEYVRSSLVGITQGDDGADLATATLPANASLFRIPRVTAELKCSLEKNRDQKLNLIFYSDRNDVRELHQQTIQLEVVAVPVPPDYLNQLKQSKVDAEDEDEQDEDDSQQQKPSGQGPQKPQVPQIFSLSEQPEERAGALSAARAVMMPMSLSDDEDRQVVSAAIPSSKAMDSPPRLLPNGIAPKTSDAAERHEVRALLERLVAKADSAQLQEQGLVEVQRRLLPSWERALVFSDGHNTRFVALAMTDTRPRLLLWQLVLRPFSVRLLYKLPKHRQIQQEQARLQRFVEQLGLAQPGTEQQSG